MNHFCVPNILRFSFSGHMSFAVRSTATHQASLWGGVVSQVWLRNYHPGWYRKYNYILGGALDGGAQVMIFILSFAVFGASRYTKTISEGKIC